MRQGHRPARLREARGRHPRTGDGPLPGHGHVQGFGAAQLRRPGRPGRQPTRLCGQGLHEPDERLRRGHLRPARRRQVLPRQLWRGHGHGRGRRGDRRRGRRQPACRPRTAAQGGPGLRQALRARPAAHRHRERLPRPRRDAPGTRRQEAQLPRFLVRDTARRGVRGPVPQEGGPVRPGRRRHPHRVARRAGSRGRRRAADRAGGLPHLVRDRHRLSVRAGRARRPPAGRRPGGLPRRGPGADRLRRQLLRSGSGGCHRSGALQQADVAAPGAGSRRAGRGR